MKILLSVLAVIIGIIIWSRLSDFSNPFLPAFTSVALMAGGMIIILTHLLNKE